MDEETVISLMGRYGELDGEISYYYTTTFTEVYRTLSNAQAEQLVEMRKNVNDIPCSGAYLYSQNIAMPEIENTDFLFGNEVNAAVPEFASTQVALIVAVLASIMFFIIFNRRQEKERRIIQARATPRFLNFDLQNLQSCTCLVGKLRSIR